ncbi:homeobox-leucine zipper protein ROC6-like [Salvia divinorum]|uniref:Homeobox-leucine zipper protein ROC6-like n=1 Tax=Salvia divinorum TaxID=28513 RepID=A0ABD1FZB7_SALDI
MENLGGMGLSGESHDGDLIGRMRGDELESRSGSDSFEGASGGEDDNATHYTASKREKNTIGTLHSRFKNLKRKSAMRIQF